MDDVSFILILALRIPYMKYLKKSIHKNAHSQIVTHEWIKVAKLSLSDNLLSAEWQY